MKKIIALLLAVAMVLGMAACGSKSETPAASTPTETKQSISVSIASEPDVLDPALNSAVDGATLDSHLFAGLAKWDTDANGNLVITADCAEELVEGVVNADGTVTYTYTLKDGMKWSDGQDLTAADFAFAWKRAASEELGADYGYMLECIAGYPNDLAVEAVDAKTLTVTLANYIAYWDELLAFPSYFPVREDVVANEAWCTDAATFVSNGAYKMTAWEHNSCITLTKNENFHDAANVTMDEIKFYLSDDANNMVTNFKNGSWLLIDDVPTNEMATLKANYPTEYFVAGQIGTYYVCFNVNQDLGLAGLSGAELEKAQAEVRKAIALLFDRNYIVEYIAQGGQVPASTFVPMGMTDVDGNEFYKNAGHNDFVGYYDVSEEAYEANFTAAVETLKKYYNYDEATGKFTNFPTMTYLYNTNEGHKAIGENLCATLAGIGITMNMDNQEWNTFLNTRKQGGYSVARNGWLADFNDPITFLDMWTTASGNNDVQFGKGAHKDVAAYSIDLTEFGYDLKVENGTWAETFDALIAIIKGCTDTETRFALMHVAEDFLMDTGCLIPLYFYTDIYMLDDSVEGFFANPLGYKYFYKCTIK